MKRDKQKRKLAAVRRAVVNACDDKVGQDYVLPRGQKVRMHMRVQYRLHDGTLLRRFLGYGPQGGTYEDLQGVTPENPDPQPTDIRRTRWPLPSKGKGLGPFRDLLNFADFRVLYCGMQSNGEPRTLTVRWRDGEWQCPPLSGLIYYDNLDCIVRQRNGDPDCRFA